MSEMIESKAPPRIGEDWTPSPRFLERVPLDFAREHLLLGVVGGTDGHQRLLIPEAGVSPALAHNVAVRLGVACRTEECDTERLAEWIDSIIESRNSLDVSPAGDQSPAVEADFDLLEGDRELLRSSGRSPIAKLLATLLLEGVRIYASDMHVQPSAAGAVVRFRVDGLLVSSHDLNREDADAVTARVKVLAGMDVTERRIPQDGRSAVTVGGKDVDLRISTIPTARGERLVIRLLDKRTIEFFEFTRLGMPREIQERFAACCTKPSGMVLVCGPTGSGKTTTLYSVLRRLASPGVNVMTLEDPIEYELDGISQSQTNRKKGITFSTGLRHILRQDPDIVMVGEIRDAETAVTAVQASLTGHTVLSTLHTNDAPGAVTRLLDLGLEPYLLNATLTCVLSQRLLRRVCGLCQGHADGCAQCGQRRYAGRVGVYELLVMSSGIGALLNEGASTSAIRQQATTEGMIGIRDAAERLAHSGVTTTEEVHRVFGVTVLEAEIA